MACSLAGAGVRVFSTPSLDRVSSATERRGGDEYAPVALERLYERQTPRGEPVTGSTRADLTRRLRSATSALRAAAGDAAWWLVKGRRSAGRSTT
jgi:hypothetical protein